MTTDRTSIAAAALVGAIAGVVGAGLGLALLARDHAYVSATIELSGTSGSCVTRTLPATLLVSKKDVVQWTVRGTCEGVNVNEVEIQFVGACQADGSKVQGLPLPQLFDETGPHKGRKIKRTVRHGEESCFSYRVMHARDILEDPELEIIY
jgi:hypothetical protein